MGGFQRGNGAPIRAAYVGLDYDLVVRALDCLGPVEEFLMVVRERLLEQDGSST